MTDNGPSPMEITAADNQRRVDEDGEEEDAFLKFIDYAKSILSLSSSPSPSVAVNGIENEFEEEEDANGPGWSWIASRILKTCISYSSGVTSAILLSDLSMAWNENNRGGAPKKQQKCILQLKKKHRRSKLANTVTIDSIYEKKFLSLTSVIEAVVVDTFVLPGTNIYMLTLGDYWSSNTIDLYLHRRFYNVADVLLKKGREVFLTGCYLRAVAGGSGHMRLLPTEYLVILLDENQDDDAMLLGTQFFSDSFSSISLDAGNSGVSYSLYARIESIGPLEIQGKYGGVQRKQITLVDNGAVRLKFLLWGEQVLLANLFSVGSMLALDRPYVASSVDSNLEACEEFCLEYGTVTQLYLVPMIQHEERICVSLTQNRYQGSKTFNAPDPSQGPIVSQVTLPCDSQGSIDFSRYPFRAFVSDLRDKMTGISLYVTVRDIIREAIAAAVFSLKVKDATGEIWVKLHFMSSWSLGRLGPGHIVYISGLTCLMTKRKSLELSWVETDTGTSFINISCLPAFLNSACLHKLSQLSDIFNQNRGTHVCRVWLDQIDQVNTRFAHAICGYFVNQVPSGDFECNFCHCSCNTEIERTFHLKITLADDNAKVLAWCTGQTATEMLQISPDEFYELPEDEQIMYPSSLEQERFTVSIVNCRRQSCDEQQHDDGVSWEVTLAMKCE